MELELGFWGRQWRLWRENECLERDCRSEGRREKVELKRGWLKKENRSRERVRCGL